MLIGIKPRIEKPHFGVAEMDWGHPLLSRATPKQSLLVAFNEGGTPLETIQTNNRPLTPSGTFPTYGFNPAGLCDRAVPAASYLAIGTEGTHITLPTASMTVAFIRRKTDTTLRASSVFGANALNLHAPYSDGTTYWDFGGGGSPNRLTWSGYSVSMAVEYWTVVGGSRGSAIYLNGAQKASQGTALSRAAGTIECRLNNNSAGVLGDAQDFNFFLLLDTEWTAGQVMMWFAEPYAFLRPRLAIRYWFDMNIIAAAAPEGGVLSSGGATLNTDPRAQVYARFS